MFDFQKLDVYQKSKNFCKEIYSILDEKNFLRVTNDQLRNKVIFHGLQLLSVGVQKKGESESEANTFISFSSKLALTLTLFSYF